MPAPYLHTRAIEEAQAQGHTHLQAYHPRCGWKMAERPGADPEAPRAQEVPAGIGDRKSADFEPLGPDAYAFDTGYRQPGAEQTGEHRRRVAMGRHHRFGATIAAA